MKRQLCICIILFIALINFGCDQQTLSPVTESEGGETGQLTEVQATQKSRDDSADVWIGRDRGDDEEPEAIILHNIPDRPTAHVVIEKAAIRGDIITFIISYSGGCKSHDFQLVGTTFQESNPLRVSAQLFHYDNDDPCDQWITEELRFNLSPLKELYFSMYDEDCDTVLINLGEDIPLDHKLTYQFCKDNPVVPPGPPLPPIYDNPNHVSEF
ncbi:MAG: hypothetical protein GWN00_03120 [Aliifodinibius sp.]|nr:hypothetical protein [Fodinibius sp.]NIV10219.1 hypothetical protein [Fodinibius sp.]NIY23839.1 hypothetical protein [Fodinibius sp.]